MPFRPLRLSLRSTLSSRKTRIYKTIRVLKIRENAVQGVIWAARFWGVALKVIRKQFRRTSICNSVSMCRSSNRLIWLRRNNWGSLGNNRCKGNSKSEFKNASSMPRSFRSVSNKPNRRSLALIPTIAANPNSPMLQKHQKLYKQSMEKAIKRNWKRSSHSWRKAPATRWVPVNQKFPIQYRYSKTSLSLNHPYSNPRRHFTLTSSPSRARPHFCVNGHCKPFTTNTNARIWLKRMTASSDWTSRKREAKSCIRSLRANQGMNSMTTKQ